MKKIAWVTDSTAFIDEELHSHPDVYVIPLTIVLDGQEYLDGIDLTPHELYLRLKTLTNPPKTSQPAVGEFVTLYEDLAKKYDMIVSVLLSSKLSGTVSSSQQAAQLVDIPVVTIDSKILTYPLSALVKMGLRELQADGDVESVIKYLEAQTDKTETYVLIGSLEQLHRSGRMNGVQFFLGSMLNVKPIICIKDGKLETKEKTRSEKKAKEKITELLRSSNAKSPIKEAYILYGLNPEEALRWKKDLEQSFPEIDFLTCPLCATIGVHAGENTLGISWYNN
ncbi:DegV family protein [Pseudoneobacillus rhizosphaerae]|uniref:Protein DegV n=1 Tax=Pseudoneobacillus rhizosphaerae TaxID=2880968 RepID=A0A9C7G9A4_9BACI|nr:DegV family protein [Pseudoneobacillus rhizosphaerae]CAG9608204.1 Protein DegV [Pseudoneobacillus rhizosphaerae]